MLDYQQRVCDEALELQEKLNKLHTFQRSITYKDIPLEERCRLHEQSRVMEQYYSILCERIAAFT